MDLIRSCRLITTMAIFVCVAIVSFASISNDSAVVHYRVGSKGQILDPEGNEFIPYGANVAIAFTGYPYVFEGNAGNGEPDSSGGGVNSYQRWSEKAFAMVAVSNKAVQLRAWGFNTLRVTALPFGDNKTPTQAETVAGIVKGVNEMTAEGFVVMLEMHSGTAKDPVVGDKVELEVRAFWDAVVPAFKKNSRVWFNFFNEPFKERNKTDAWIALHAFYIDRYRASPFNAENLVVCDLPGYGQALDQLASGKLDALTAKRQNVLFGWHAYGSVGPRLSYADTADPEKSYSTFDQMLTEVTARGHAVVAGELGIAVKANQGNSGPWKWNVNGFNNLVTGIGPKGQRFGPALAAKHKVGLLLWHLTGDSSYYHLYAISKDRGPWWQTVNSAGALVNRDALSEQARLFWDYKHPTHKNR